MSATKPLRLRVPHDATNDADAASFPNPDHDNVLDAFEIVNHMLFLAEANGITAEQVAAVRLLHSLADAYMHLTTHDVGQEACVKQLRGVWRARRAQNGDER